MSYDGQTKLYSAEAMLRSNERICLTFFDLNFLTFYCCFISNLFLFSLINYVCWIAHLFRFKKRIGCHRAHFGSENASTKVLMCDQLSISSPRSRDTSLPALPTVQQVAPRSLNYRPRKPRLEHQRIGRHATPKGAAIWRPVQKLREWINLSSRHTINQIICISVQ